MPHLNLHIHLANWCGCLRQRTFIHTSQDEDYQPLNFDLQSFASLKDLIQPTRPMPSPPSNLYADEVEPARDAEDRETFYYAPQKKPFSIDRYYLKEHSLFSPCGHAIQVPEIATPSSNETTWFLSTFPLCSRVGLFKPNKNFSFSQTKHGLEDGSSSGREAGRLGVRGGSVPYSVASQAAAWMDGWPASQPWLPCQPAAGRLKLLH